MADYNRFDTPMAPGSHWPDGSPVSNWSQAVASMARYGSVTGRALAPRTASQQESERQVEMELVLVAA